MHRELRTCEEVLDDLQLEILQTIGEIADDIGERCYLVGGAVRDCLLGKENKDLDMVCSESERIVDSLAKKGKLDLNRKGIPKMAKFPKFGTFQVKIQDEEVEFVDPRKETYTYQSHKPEKVEKGTFVDDALRRDFTLNALFLGIQSDDWMQVEDFTGKGIEDLKNGVLRTPLDPDTTFIDDPSRLFRLARFKSCKGFNIDPITFESARRNAHEVNEMIQVNRLRERVPRESVKQMMDKGIMCKGYLKTLDNINVLEQIIPEVEPMKDLEQDSDHHLWDVWTHTLKVVHNLTDEKVLKWAGLFHDIGKPPTFDKRGTFHNHAVESEQIAKEVMTRLKFSNNDIKRISHIVRNHMSILNLISQDDPRRGKELTDRAVRRFAVQNDGYESDLIEFAYADTKASGVHWKKDHRKIERFENRLHDLQLGLGMSGGKKFKLEVSGHDIMNTLGIKPGPRVGQVQKELIEKVVDGELKNEKEELIDYMRWM